MFTHSEFDIVSNFTASLCGPITYTASFLGSIINTTTQPMSYDALSQQFAIYSEDFNLLDFKAIQVQAFLQEYPTVISPIETAQIEFIDPCIDPFTLTVPVQTAPEPYLYTENQPQLSFTPLAATVDPSICSITYGCQITPVDLCSVSDGATNAQFDTNTGQYTFSSIDMANYVPGTYSMTVTATSGLRTASFTVDLQLVNPCFTVDLMPQASLFSDATYVLGGPSVKQVWQDSQLFDPQTQVDCGPITVEFFMA